MKKYSWNKKLVLFIVIAFSAIFYSGCSSTPAKEVKPDFYEAQRVNVGDTQVAKLEKSFYLRIFDSAKNPVKEIPFSTLEDLKELLPKMEKERNMKYKEDDIRVMYEFVKAYSN